MLAYQDAFNLVAELGLTNQEAAEFLFRLKNAYDSSQGLAVDPNQSLTDPIPAVYPHRVSVESQKRSFFFRLQPNQPRVEKNQVMYHCEHCTESVRRMDVKQHVLERHEVELQ